MGSTGPGADSLSEAIVGMRSRLFAFACTLTSDREEAADLVQETLERGLTASDRFAPGTNLKAWLFAILHNLHANRRRDARARPIAVSIDEIGVDAMPTDVAISPVEQDVLDRARLEEVRDALRSLPAIFALPLRMVAVDELSYAEVAAILGVPPGTVMSRIYRARRLLLRRLAGGRA